MDLINGTKLVANATQVLDKHAQPWLVVVAKATYDIPGAPAELPAMSVRQRGLLYKDEFVGEEGLSAPLFENDFVPTKAACDVIVKGTARSPRGRPVTETTVGMMVGSVKKIIRVVGNRHWIKTLTGYEPSSPEPFVEIPVHYGRAFGGSFNNRAIGSDDTNDFSIHPGNPVGRGHARGRFVHLVEGRPLPNLEAVDDPVRNPDTLHAPASLGPIGRSWSPRLKLAGTYDQNWREEIFPLLPPDFDERFYQCAPADQQLPHPRGGEEVTLLNLLPGGGLTRFRLPDLTLPMVVLSTHRELTMLTPVVDTVAIDADAATFDLVWRARMALRRSLREVHTVAIGSVCRRWWKSRVYGTEDCGCGGVETNDEELALVTEALD